MVSVVLGQAARPPGGLVWAHAVSWGQACPRAQWRTPAVPHTALPALSHVLRPEGFPRLSFKLVG